MEQEGRMSGIYISGMEMPKDGWLTLRLYPTGEVGVFNKQAAACSFHDIAIPVHDHGRLVDAEEITLPKGFFETVTDVSKFYEWLAKQPTIIPADKGCEA